ncbi:hypothetical protein BKA66DRAFT_568222 [Pyrenochaeta sp. MPI-SDFR-AT-0127]|nr:hypothetical protein BKA66DRAFT_568222 [Pyrenochaeta sp. MPI-SDFR-AT-0127]
MVYTKNYYHVLGLEAPAWASKQQVSVVELRRAYKLALLAAHPDKSVVASKTKAGYTVDDVKEAYSILAEGKSRAEYDSWLLHHGDILRISGGADTQEPSTDFILGLELLDLSDFDVFEPSMATNTPTSTSNSTPSSTTSETPGEDGRMEWTRPCRCGMDKGFRILEEELEDAEARGEKEVLVGCEGCSLWVRVGFDVEEG